MSSMTMSIALPMVLFMKSGRSSNNIRFMSSNMLTVMILLVSLITNSVDDLLTLLNEDSVNNLLASCLGDLARVLVGMLVALLLLFVLTLRSGVVTFVASLSSTLVIVIGVVLINNPGVMSNNTRMKIAGLLFLMAVGSCDILALFNIGDINNYFIINKAFFMFLLLGDFVTLLIFLVMTMRTIMLLVLDVTVVLTRLGSAINKCGREKESNEFHLGLWRIEHFPP